MAKDAKKKQDVKSGTPDTPRRRSGKAFKKNPKANHTKGKSILGYRKDRFMKMAGVLDTDSPMDAQIKVDDLRTSMIELRRDRQNRTKTQRLENFIRCPHPMKHPDAISSQYHRRNQEQLKAAEEKRKADVAAKFEKEKRVRASKSQQKRNAAAVVIVKQATVTTVADALTSELTLTS